MIRLDGVRKRFAEVAAVDGIDLSIGRGELFALLGASGSGKSTLLRLLAGFELPEEGRVLIDGIDMARVPAYERPVNMVFQSYALFPHMTVAQNVAFGLKQEGLPRRQVEERVQAMLELVQMADLGRRRPDQLSGGQRQRVALARALAKQPKVLLLDEPLSALDRKLREQTQFELAALQQRLGITFVMVTHDQEEAMAMASRIAVMRQGRIEQVGAPVEVYETPANRYVAGFIGTANLFEGIAEPDGVRVDGLGRLRTAPPAGIPAGAAAAVLVRPEKVAIGRTPPPSSEDNVAATVHEIGYRGGHSIYHLRLDDGRVLQAHQANLRHAAAVAFERGERVWASWHPGNAVVLAE